MPQSNQAQAGAGTIFAEASIYITVNGGTQPVLVGMMQEVEFDDAWDLVEAYGPGSMHPQAAAYGKGNCTVKAKTLDYDARLALAMLGGTLAFATSTTTHTRKKNDKPTSFVLVAQSPADGSDKTRTCNFVLSTKFSDAMKLHTYGEISFEGKVLPDSNGNLWTDTYAGNQTAS